MSLKAVETDFVPYVLSPLPPEPWLVFAAHADDESLGMGGTLLLARQHGIGVSLVILTDGAAGGENNSGQLQAIREQEAGDVARYLSLDVLEFWRESDRGLAPCPELFSRVAALVDKLEPGSVFFPAMMEYHPDHRAAAALVWQGLEQLSYTGCRLAYEISCQSRVNRFIDISAVRGEKKELAGIYASQVTQNNYLEVMAALDCCRTFSLPPEVKAAEGFYEFAPGEAPGEMLQEFVQLCTVVTHPQSWRDKWLKRFWRFSVVNRSSAR